MKPADSVSILASFATLKTLSDEKRYGSAYQLLSEFMHYVIYTESLYSFSAIEMKKWLHTIFGFEIPEAVVITAARSLSYLTRQDGIYTVNQSEFVPDKTVAEAKQEEFDRNEVVIGELEKYILKRKPEATINQEQLTRDIIAFLIDGSTKSSGQYFDLISEFVIKKENDSDVQDFLKRIREGSVLYIGLTYNINETGSFTKQLTLFLDTEILFSLVGYNGEIYRTLADDFLTQVKNANLKGEKIKLTYFPEIEKEIDDFFATATSIVAGKTLASSKPAMMAITNGCQTTADVEVKKSDFYYELKCRGIHIDKRDNYYSEDNKPFNLESIEYSNPKDQESWRYISHVNKLRKGQLYPNNIEAEYLFVTATSNTIRISREYSDKLKIERDTEHMCDFAVSLNRITNLIWYKLGNGFGKKEYPSNVSAILKARMALASSITHNVERVFSDTKEQFKNGQITAEQLAARIITLRNKPTLPEEIKGDIIEESLDFSPEYINRYEEEVKSNKALVKEKDQIIRDLTAQQQLDLQKKDNIIAEKEQTIESQREENQVLAEELHKYHQKDEKRRRIIGFIRNILRFVGSLLWKIAIIIAIAGIALFVEMKVDSNIPLYIGGAIDIGCIILTILSAIKIDFQKCFNKQA